MRPDLDRFFEVAMIHLMTKVGPAQGTGFEQASTMVLGLMLNTAREEFERAVARRVEENAALRALFRDSLSAVEDSLLGQRLLAAAETCDTSLRVSPLEQDNAALRALLIELHAHVEELASDEARSVEAAIWQELVASTERRRLSLGAF